NWANMGASNPRPNFALMQNKTSYYRGVFDLNGTVDTSNTVTVIIDCYEIGLSNNDTTCSGGFYDAAGIGGNYNNNANFTHTFYPQAGNKLNVDFSSFNTESGLDVLTVYDGNSTAAPVIGTYSGTSIPPSMTSSATDGSLTFTFTSDGSVVRSGWEALFSCSCDTTQPLPVTHNPLPATCANATPFTLSGGRPIGGVYTGTGVLGGTSFDPSLAGVGSFALTYTYTSPLGCSGDTSITITVLGAYADTSNASICQGTTYLWNGNTYTTQGSYTDTLTASTGCDSIVTLNLTVTPLPTVQITGLDTSYCDTTSIVTLIGVPAGGTFTGSGIIGTQFDPSNAALGSNTILYNYTDNNSCSNTATKITTVRACNFIGLQRLQATNFQLYPNPSTGWITIEQDNPTELFLEVFAENGQLILQKTTTDNKFQLEFNNQPNGVYFIRITTATTSFYKKVVLMKP
ncbi:MAG: T9SS type A sorting domain-containing protein, partial [Aureispira sp.]